MRGGGRRERRRREERAGERREERREETMERGREKEEGKEGGRSSERMEQVVSGMETLDEIHQPNVGDFSVSDVAYLYNQKGTTSPLLFNAPLRSALLRSALRCSTLFLLSYHLFLCSLSPSSYSSYRNLVATSDGRGGLHHPQCLCRLPGLQQLPPSRLRQLQRERSPPHASQGDGKVRRARRLLTLRRRWERLRHGREAR